MRRNRESSITRKSTDDLRQDLSKLKSQLSSTATQQNKSASLTNLRSTVYYGQNNPTKRKAIDVLISQRQRGRSSYNLSPQYENEVASARTGSNLPAHDNDAQRSQTSSSEKHQANGPIFQPLATGAGGNSRAVYSALESLRDPKASSNSPGSSPGVQINRGAKENQQLPSTQQEPKPGLEVDEKAMLETRTPTYSEKKLNKLQENNETLLHDLNKLMASIDAGEMPVQDLNKDAVIPSQEEELKKLLKEYALKNQSSLQNGYTSPVGLANGSIAGGKVEFQESLEEVTLLKNEVNNLKKSLTNSEKEKSQYSNQLELTLSEYQLETDSLKRDLKLKTDQCNLAEQKVKDLLEQNSWLTKEQIRLRNESRSYESVAEESSKMSSQIIDLLQRVDSITEERDILAMKCENLEAKNEMLVKASEEHEQIRNDQKLAQREIQKRADEIEQLEKAQEESSKEHAQSMHNLQDALKDLKHNYQQQSIKYNDLLHEFNRLKSVVSEGPNSTATGQGAAPKHVQGAVDQFSPGGTATATAVPPGATGSTVAAVQTYGGPDIPTEPVPVIVFIAKYTYDPLKYSPNDNPELELSVTKGDYVYIHGDMDDDGFFEGELLSGHRGLVPSNFVEPVNEKELPDLLKSHLQKLRNRSLSNLHLNQIAAGNYGLNPKVDSGVQVLEDDITEFPNRAMNSSRFGGPGDPSLLYNSSSANINTSPLHQNHLLSSPKAAAAVNAVPKFSPTHYYSPNHNPNLPSNQIGQSSSNLYNSQEINKYSPSLTPSSPMSSLGGGDDFKHLTNGPSKQLSPKTEKSSQNSAEEVAPPQKIVVEKMLLNSVLISWSPSNENVKKTDCYEIFIDGVKQTSVKPYAKLRALLHNIDTNEAHKVSIRTVTTRGLSSKDQQCTVVVGKGAKTSPYDLKAINILSSTADIVWWPSNSNLAHGLVVNQGEEVRIPAGQFKWNLTGLTPSSVYKVSLRPFMDAPTDNTSSPESSPLSKIEFKTLPGGTPDCPSDVRIQQGSQPGTVAVSWRPVVDSSMGNTSNGAFLTGYEIVRDSGEVIATVSDPVLDRVILSTSSLRGAKRISVRTTSYNGASIDSKSVRIPSSLSNSPRNDLPSRLAAAQGHMFSPSKAGAVNNHHQLSPGSHKVGGGGGGVGGIYPLSPNRDVDFHPDYISETSETSELSDIMEEGPFGAAAAQRSANMRPSSKFPDFSLENVAVPSTMPSVYDYQQYLKEPPRLNDRASKKSRPRMAPPQSQIHANEKAYTSDSELSQGKLSRRNMKQGGPSFLMAPGYRDDHLVLYESSPSRIGVSRGSSRNGGPRFEGADAPRPSVSALRGKRMSQRHRYFVALYNYNPATMSPNKDSAHEEIAFREADVIKIYGDKDEDDFYYGETRGGQRGFVPSNMVMELSYHNANVSPRNDSSRLRDRASISSLRKMVALFDYDPIKTSPNPDAEDVELSFRAGDLMYIFGQVDEDGFYVAELQSGQRGLVPSNFLEEVDDAKFVSPKGPRSMNNSRKGIASEAAPGNSDPYNQLSLMESVECVKPSTDPGELTSLKKQHHPQPPIVFTSQPALKDPIKRCPPPPPGKPPRLQVPQITRNLIRNPTDQEEYLSSLPQPVPPQSHPDRLFINSEPTTDVEETQSVDFNCETSVFSEDPLTSCSTTPALFSPST